MANWMGLDTGGGSTTATNKTATNKKTTDYHTSGFHTTSGSWGDTNASYTPTYSDYVESYTPAETNTNTSYTPSYSTNYSSGGGSSYSSGGGSSSGSDSQLKALQDQIAALQKANADAEAEAERQAQALALANQAYAKSMADAKAEQQRLMDEYNAKTEEARQNAITTANTALDEQGKAAEAKYNDQLVSIGNDYEDLRRQSEVNRYKAMINQRESLANQGRLEGGAGRQEYLTLNNNYSNNLNKINLQEAAERTAIANAIKDMWANIGTQKAQNEAATLDTYANSLNQQLQLENLYNYIPSTSDYYNAALALSKTSPYTTPAVLNDNSDGATSTAAKVLTLEDLMEYMGLNA